MTLKTQIISDLPVFFDTDEFAETIVYTNSSSVDASISAIVSMDDPLQEPYVRGESTATCTIEVKASDVPSPEYGETFTFGGYTWEFDPRIGVTRMTDNVLSIFLERQMS